MSHTRTVSDLGWAHENQFDVRGFVMENHEGLFTGGGIFFADRLIFDDRSKLVMRAGFSPKSYDDINSEGIRHVPGGSTLAVERAMGFGRRAGVGRRHRRRILR